jgi:uncharacterized protein YecE (DUF72 family)
VRVRVGTSGFSYPEWKGGFYPPDIPPGGMLAYYATRLPAVEVNNTFYRLPSARTLASWRGQVPADFRFAIKASERITHRARLREAAEPVGYLYRAVAELGPNLGPVLFQLPPQMRKDLPRLSDFLDLLPRGGQAAFEFRHPSWFSDEVYEALRARGAALCVAESEDLEVPVVATAGWGYLRLHKTGYDAAGLSAWAERILEQPWQETFAFFQHEEIAGPQLAAALSALVEARP